MGTVARGSALVVGVADRSYQRGRRVRVARPPPMDQSAIAFAALDAVVACQHGDAFICLACSSREGALPGASSDISPIPDHPRPGLGPEPTGGTLEGLLDGTCH